MGSSLLEGVHPLSLAANIRSQSFEYQQSVPQGIWRWRTRVDVSKAAPQFSIHDILTPFGLFRDAIPIPGAVITAMAQSIADLQQTFTPLIVLSPTSFTFTLDEGRGFGLAQTGTVSNGGTYGSLLDASITSSATYVQVSPASVSSLAFNASGQFSVAADSSSLLAVGSPYSATLTVQDANATNTPQVIRVTIVVRPKATIALTPTSLNFTVSGALTGSFPPVPTQTFNLQNSGPSGSVLAYQIQKLTGLSPWLTSFSPSSGSLNAGASQPITVGVQPTVSMLIGTYTETLRVSGYSSNMTQDLLVTFVVNP